MFKFECDNYIINDEDNVVVAIDDKYIAKKYSNSHYKMAVSDLRKFRYANSINGLLAKCIGLYQDMNDDYWLVMERLYSLEIRSFGVMERKIMIEELYKSLVELHNKGFVHRDILAQQNIESPFKNFILTNKGIRLVDVGMSVICSDVDILKFKTYVEQELKEFELLKNYITTFGML